MNIDKLKGMMLEKKISRENLAEHLGLSISTINNKLCGTSEFDISEFKKIASLLQLNDDEMVKLIMS